MPAPLQVLLDRVSLTVPGIYSVHHRRGIHHYNFPDLPLFDVLLGTFRNPKDLAANDFAQSVRPSQHQGA